MRRTIVIFQFPIIGIEMKAYRNIPEILSLDSGLDLVRGSWFSISKIGRTEQAGRVSGQRFDQTLSGVEFDVGNGGRHLAQIGVRKRVISDLLPVGNDTFNDLRVRLAVFANYKESTFNIFLFQDIEYLWRPDRIGAVIKRQGDLTGLVAGSLYDV